MSRHSRWIKFFVIPLAISIAAIVGIVAWANSGDPRSEARRGQGCGAESGYREKVGGFLDVEEDSD